MCPSEGEFLLCGPKKKEKTTFVVKIGDNMKFSGESPISPGVILRAGLESISQTEFLCICICVFVFVYLCMCVFGFFVFVCCIACWVGEHISGVEPLASSYFPLTTLSSLSW